MSISPMKLPGGRVGKSSKPAGTVSVVRAGGPATPKTSVTSTSPWSAGASTIRAAPSSVHEALFVKAVPAFVAANSRKRAVEATASRAVWRRPAIPLVGLGTREVLGDTSNG